MTRTGAVARVGTPRVVPTAAAWRALSAICRTEGRVVLVHAPAHGGLLCFGERDYVPGPKDVRLAEICGCALFADVREVIPGCPLVVDVVPDRAGDDGPTFTLRELPTSPAEKKDLR